MSFGNYITEKTQWEATLTSYEECDCGDDIRHNNGGNYHSRVWECTHPNAGKKLWFEVDTRDFGHPEEIALIELPCGCPAVAWRNTRWDSYIDYYHIHLMLEEPDHGHDWEAAKDYAHFHGTWFGVEGWGLE